MQALALIEHLRYRERLWPLIVTPAAIQENWVLEIQKWFTGKPGKPRRLEIYRVDEPSVNRAAALERREDKLKKRAEWTERAERAERAESGARGVCDARARKIEVETADDAQLDEMRLQTTLTWRAQRDGPLLISFEQLRRTADARAPATRAQAELGRMLLEAPNLVLCDEGQTLRNSRTQTFKVLERFKTARRLMLTGKGSVPSRGKSKLKRTC